MKYSAFDIFVVVMILVVVFLIGFLIWMGTGWTEIEVYSVGCEVSQMAYAEEAVSRSQTKPVYKMGVRNDEFATTLDINSNQFAQFMVGDVVEVDTPAGTAKYKIVKIARD